MFFDARIKQKAFSKHNKIIFKQKKSVRGKTMYFKNALVKKSDQPSQFTLESNDFAISKLSAKSF